MIHFDNITFGYKGASTLFKDFSFRMDDAATEGGLITAIMGSSGIGKSTVLKLVAGIEQVSSGEVHIGVDRNDLSYLPQEPVLFEHLSIDRNAKYFAHSSRHKMRFDEDRFVALSKSLDVEHLLLSSVKVTELSGGEQQRIALLRALSIKPTVLLMDEPTKGMDTGVRKSFLLMLKELVLKERFAVLYVTHDRIEAELIADHVLYLSSDRGANSVRSSHFDTIGSFTASPPTIDAVQKFSYPMDRLVKVVERMEEGIGREPYAVVQLATEQDDEYFYLSTDQSEFELVPNGGFVIKEIRNSGIYSRLFLENGDIVSVLAHETSYEVGMEVALSGRLNKYDINGQLVGDRMVLEENRIVG